jgi:alpha-L-fucosidase 2
LFDAHPPFQIDGNFGGAAGLMEMLVQSWGGEVRLLPALPSAWPTGEIKGIRARGGLVIDLRWRAGKLAALAVKGPAGAPLRLRYLGAVKDVTLDAQGVYRQSGVG